ncbi:hypothetical protein ACEPPN_016500 [Leptodophora sp. 'Broadleaf-Isolate-01']
MTWASITAAPRPAAKVSAVKIEPKPTTAVPTAESNDIEQASLQIEALSVEDTNKIESLIKKEDAGTVEASETDNGRGSSAQNEDVEEDLNPTGSKNIQFCIDNKDAILDLHSSVAFTKVFQFAILANAISSIACLATASAKLPLATRTAVGARLNEASVLMTTNSQSIGISTATVVQKVKDIMEGKGLADVNAPEATIKIMPKKMSQKVKRGLDREAREMAGL